jgi:hypothetical protein
MLTFHDNPPNPATSSFHWKLFRKNILSEYREIGLAGFRATKNPSPDEGDGSTLK